MLKHLFLLDPDIIFLNHGSFGACPRPVFETYQAWQRRLEKQPVLFLDRQFAELHKAARRALGAYLGVDSEDLVYISNATHGVNIVARALDLQQGDEILTCNHEYGACNKTWEFICRKTGANYIRQPIPLPLQSPQAFVERLWQAVTPRTKLIFLSHITSPTAQRLPVETLCQRARQASILTLIDGAHAPGQIPLQLETLGADFYTGNCHKWLLSPKGAAFLYTRREMQPLIEPLVISWGYQADRNFSSGSRYIDLLQWAGTDDPSAALSVPAAIQFMQAHDWERLRQECSALLRQALERIGELTGLPSPYPCDPADAPQPLPPQIGIAPLPHIADLKALKSRLYDEFHIEVPLVDWNGQHFVRISVQAYNSQADIDALLAALEALFPAASLK
ncbi:MAG: aminotransferase class V-fold PLP-dependent enzyme [Anaerolineales bacterium]|nr:aminotransferase class V-fold PLP-dependent enzyme [Anaerolineales bacterium]